MKLLGTSRIGEIESSGRKGKGGIPVFPVGEI